MRVRRSKAVRRVSAGALALTLTLLVLTLAACGSSGSGQAPGAATPSANSAGAYLNCLLQHRGGGPGSARTACAPVRPADLAAVLLTFENCLKAHGVSVPPPPAQGRRAALLQFVGGLQDGSPSQRSALAACKPSRFPG
ncbi:MAG TPA: hypothetical protein VHY58_20860 [Streptosporangiaceae bacterium]|nr:hypothetical protein [Streptosporangiaceae bacterium]